MTPDQINWLTWGAIQHRPHGAPKWDEAGTRALIERCCGSWSLDVATLHVLAHARDPKAKTPGVITGTAPSAEPQKTPRYPPKAADECATHPGEWLDACRICAGPKAADGDEKPRPTERRPPSEAYQRARQAIKEGL